MATEKHDRNYDVRDLNKVFAVGSLVLLVTVILMIVDDYSREWKDVQRRFARDETSRTEREIREAEKALNSADMKRLQADLKKAEEEIEKRSKDYDAAKD